MKKLHLFLLTTIFFSACSQTQRSSMPVQNTIKIEEGDSIELIIEKAAHVVPTPNQLAALQNEFIAFIHFGPNTFTRMEWGNGKEDPKIFDLKQLDTDQWCEAMKAAGMKMVLITVKHHDGFVLWQSRYTKHGIMSTNFKNGKGDILKDLSASCQKYGLKLGVYLSPADLYQIENPEGLYGNLSKYTKRTIPREVQGRPFTNKTKFEFTVDDYNEYFLNQLFEILTEYGPIHEVWFDGAHALHKLRNFARLAEEFHSDFLQVLGKFNVFERFGNFVLDFLYFFVDFHKYSLFLKIKTPCQQHRAKNFPRYHLISRQEPPYCLVTPRMSGERYSLPFALRLAGEYRPHSVEKSFSPRIFLSLKEYLLPSVPVKAIK